MEKDIFSHSWHFIEPCSSDFICEYCKGILRRPMMAACCGNYFCSACIEEVCDSDTVATQKFNCPECKESDIQALPNKKMWDKILKLQVKCLNSQHGCAWTGELGKGASHLNPESGDCDYIDTECTRGCGTTVVKAQLSQHLEHNCPKRPVTCPYCSTVDNYEVINGEHQNKCPALVTCPNNCGVKKIRHATLTKHFSKCPEKTVKCKFHYAGCIVPIQRKHLTTHLQKNLEKHLNLQTDFFLAEIKRRDDQLKRLVTEKEEHLHRLREFHTQQLQEKDKIINNGLLSKEVRKLIEENLGKELKSLQAKYSELELNVNGLDKLIATLDRNKLHHICMFHEGKYNTQIWKGKYGDRKVAIKQCSMEALSSSILPEVNALLRLKHSNIVEVYGILIDQDPACIVMEYLPMGNLLDYLRTNNSLRLRHQIMVCRQVAQGLEYMQGKLCLHRNVMARNVLLSESSNFHCKLSDFSTSTFVSYPQEYVSVDCNYKYPIKWCAPEVIQGIGFCLKSDVWSFGMLIWEVATNGREPFLDLSNEQVAEHITVNEIVMPHPEGCPAGLYAIMLESWNQDPLNRPTLKELMDRMLQLEL